MTEHALIVLIGLPACLVWVVWGVDWAFNARRIKKISEAPASSASSSSVSIVFTALNEEAEIQKAAASFLAQRGVRLDVVAVNDRSTDQTGPLLEGLKPRHPNLKVLTISSLPDGWLGKPHALAAGAKEAAGEWVLFTDADVLLHPDALRAAAAWAEEKGLDHVVVYPDLGKRSFWEEIFLSSFLVVSSGAVRPWKVKDPGTSDAIGIGAFNLVRKSAYQSIGGHADMPLAVVDDVELGQRLKKNGFKSDVLLGHDRVSVDWHRGLNALFGGMEKNFFGAFHFNAPAALMALAGLFYLAWAPWILLMGGGASALAGAAGVIGQAGVFLFSRRLQPARLLSGIFLPVGFTFIGLALLRSIFATLIRGGIQWRGTFYPLSLLAREKKRGWKTLIGRY